MRISDWSSDVCSSDLAAGIRLTAGIATKELRHDVQGQRPANAVEGKALPELGHEQHPELTRMPQPLARRRRDENVRATGRERVCQTVQYVEVAGSSKKIATDRNTQAHRKKKRQ